VSRNPGREAGKVVTGRWQRRDDPGADQAGLRQRELRDDPGGLLPTGKREITPGTQHPALCLRHDRTFIPRWVLHRHAVEPMMHWL
jgi:hypothetical protein